MLCEYGCGPVTEVWRDVLGYEGFYEVSNLGRVRSLDRIAGTVKPFPVYGRVLRYKYSHPDGYPSVTLCVDGRRRTLTVHSLVNKAFHGPRPLGPTVFETRHRDGNAKHVCETNLCWGTKSANVLDQVLHGTHAMSSRTHCTWGHVLAAPNLETSPSLVETGRRGCLACLRAHSYVAQARRRGKPIPDFQALADRYYRRIFAEVARDTLAAA